MQDKTTTVWGDRLEQLKIRLKLNNSKLAKAAGVTGQAIADIINGKAENPRVNVLIGICQTYQVNYEWLLEGTGPMLRSESNTLESTMSDNQVFGQKLMVRDAYIAELLSELSGKPEVAFDQHNAEFAQYVMDTLIPVPSVTKERADLPGFGKMIPLIHRFKDANPSATKSTGSDSRFSAKTM